MVIRMLQKRFGVGSVSNGGVQYASVVSGHPGDASDAEDDAQLPRLDVRGAARTTHLAAHPLLAHHSPYDQP